MKTNVRWMSGVAVTCPGCADADPAPTEEADDHVVTNGYVYTVDRTNPRAEAVALRGNEIAYVGDTGGAEAFVGAETEEIDLEGRLLPPGLDQNLFEIDAERIPDTTVLATMFDGRIVHDVTWGLGDAELADLDPLDELQAVPAHITEQP